jgi:hypothetical protein
MESFKEIIGTDIYMPNETMLLTTFVRSNAIDEMFNGVMEVYSESGGNMDKVISKYTELYSPLRGFIEDGMHYAIACWINRLMIDCVEANKPAIAIETYIIKNNETGNYKIGRTGKGVQKRISQFKGMAGSELIIEHVIKGNFEKELHQKFASKRTAGEWFCLTEEDVTKIKDMEFR